MKIRIAADHTLSEYLERQYVWCLPNEDIGMLVNAQLPEPVMQSIKLVSKHFKLKHPPTVMYTKSVHGSDIGAVIIERKDEELFQKQHEKDPNSKTFPLRSLIARISFGPGNYSENETRDKREKRLQKTGWDPMEFGRYHISVTGIRTFFPENFVEIALQETTHVSLRWVNEKYEDWNVLNTSEKGEQYSHPWRTSHVQYHFVENGYTRDGRTDEVQKARAILGTTTTFEPKKIIGMYAKEVGNDDEHAYALHEFGFKHEPMPEIGFEPVFKKLEIATPASAIPKMSMKDATQFMFDYVLPTTNTYVGFKKGNHSIKRCTMLTNSSGLSMR